MDNKKVADVLSSLEEKVKENSEKLEQLRERVEKLENPGAHENRDVNDNPSNYAENVPLDVSDKVTDYAQKAAQDSRGPLKPGELLTHFTSNDFGKKKKEAMGVIKKFPNNIDEVKNQLSYILANLEIQVTCRKRENELDTQLIQRIRKFNETLEKEQEKGKKSNTKIKFENGTDQSQNMTTRNKKRVEIAGKSDANKHELPVKQEEKRGRKRKSSSYDDEDDDAFGSEAIEMDEVAARYKRLKLRSRTPSQERIESNLEQSECNGNEETVHEKRFYFRGKHIG